MENDRKTSRGDVERYDLEILLRRPSLRTNLPRRISQVCLEEIPAKETSCGLGYIQGQWLQSFAKRNSFTFIYGLLGSFYGSYYAYFYGVITTLEKRFKISSLTTGIIAATGDVIQVIMCLVLSRCVPTSHRPKWIGFGVLLIVASTVVFTLPHFLHTPNELKNLNYTRQERFPHHNETDGTQCTGTGKSQTCTKNVEGTGSIIVLILAQCLHGIGGSLYFIVGKSYNDDNIEKYQPPSLLSLLYIFKVLGPAFGYWLSSVCLKIYEHPTLTPDVNEDDSHWIGAWWFGSLVIGFIITILGLLVAFFPTTLPKTAIKRIQNGMKRAAENRQSAEEGRGGAFKRFIINRTFTCTHFAAIFNVLGFMAYFIFLPKYAESHYQVPASKTNLIVGSVTLLSSAVGIVIANSVVTRYRPSARALASWTVVAGILATSGLVSYIFLNCQAYDDAIKMMVDRISVTTCTCFNTKYRPVCDDSNRSFMSFCHAGCENILQINYTQGYKSCNETTVPLTTRKVFKGFCRFDCYSDFLKFIIVTCIVTFTYATGRTLNYWFETKSKENQKKFFIPSFGMTLGLLTSIPVPIVFGYLLDESCLLWEGNCKLSGHCWLYDNKKLRFSMNLTAVGFAIIGIIYDIGIWYSVKDLELFDDTYYYVDERDENKLNF